MQRQQTYNQSLTQSSAVDKEYAKALANSRLVSILKFALPAFGVFIIVGFIAMSYLNTVIVDGVVIESAGIEDGKIVMNNPVLAGQSKEDLPYRLEAERAIQEIGQTSLISLEGIKAELPMNDSETVTIAASEGLFDQEKEFMTFVAPFTVNATNGMVAQFKKGEYDISSGEFSTDENVDIKFTGSHITANSLKMTNSGKDLLFDQNVKMTIDPSLIRNKK